MSVAKKSRMIRFLDGVEHYGNKLPHPFWLFCLLILLVCGVSVLLEGLGVVVHRPELTTLEKKAILVALGATVLAMALWMLTIVPAWGLLRHRDPDPALYWRSPFFRGLIPVLFSLFTVGGVAYGLTAGTIRKADDVLGFMTDSMRLYSQATFFGIPTADFP